MPLPAALVADTITRSADRGKTPTELGAKR